MPPKEVFISHSSRDATTTASLTETLRNHGVPAWHSPTTLIGAQEWQDEIGRALRRCDWFLVLLSENSINSIWVKRELGYALRHSQYEGKILPVTLEPCDYDELSWTLGDFQIVDMHGDYQQGCTNILRAWGIGLDETRLVRP